MWNCGFAGFRRLGFFVCSVGDLTVLCRCLVVLDLGVLGAFEFCGFWGTWFFYFRLGDRFRYVVIDCFLSVLFGREVLLLCVIRLFGLFGGFSICFWCWWLRRLWVLL